MDVASVAELGGLGAQAAKGAGKAIGQQLQRQVAMNPLERQIGAIKPKGGNWITGSVEQALKPLKRDSGSISLADLERGWAEAGLADSPGAATIRAHRASDEALNKWIDTKLTKYVKNEMATPDDRSISGSFLKSQKNLPRLTARSIKQWLTWKRLWLSVRLRPR
ncbi:MAG: hypothetical protein EBZ52_09095 [Actinobacteria bacterium]|nr:hypothetical protein [Actinomycetota bacterium]